MSSTRSLLKHVHIKIFRINNEQRLVTGEIVTQTFCPRSRASLLPSEWRAPAARARHSVAQAGSRYIIQSRQKAARPCLRPPPPPRHTHTHTHTPPPPPLFPVARLSVTAAAGWRIHLGEGRRLFFLFVSARGRTAGWREGEGGGDLTGDVNIAMPCFMHHLLRSSSSTSSSSSSFGM